MALSWLKIYLDKNDCYCPVLASAIVASTAASSKINQSYQCNTVLEVQDPKLKTTIYPNPTKDVVFVNVREISSYQLISLTGQIVTKGIVTSSKNQIDLSKLPSGIYFLHINNQVIKVVKK